MPRSQVQPNASHLALFELQALGKIQFLITQNTDNLHRKSGIEAERLAELHGNGQLMRCEDCERVYTRQDVGWDTERWGPGYRTQQPVPAARSASCAATTSGRPPWAASGGSTST